MSPNPLIPWPKVEPQYTYEYGYDVQPPAGVHIFVIYFGIVCTPYLGYHTKYRRHD